MSTIRNESEKDISVSVSYVGNNYSYLQRIIKESYKKESEMEFFG